MSQEGPSRLIQMIIFQKPPIGEELPTRPTIITTAQVGIPTS